MANDVVNILTREPIPDLVRMVVARAAFRLTRGRRISPHLYYTGWVRSGEDNELVLTSRNLKLEVGTIKEQIEEHALRIIAEKKLTEYVLLTETTATVAMQSGSIQQFNFDIQVQPQHGIGQVMVQWEGGSRKGQPSMRLWFCNVWRGEGEIVVDGFGEFPAQADSLVGPFTHLLRRARERY
jgi:hypothetical protein